MLGKTQLSRGYTLYLDAGHGGLAPGNASPQLRYTTAPAKMFKHKDTTNNFHGEGYFLEGVWNRLMADKLEEQLLSFGVSVIPLHRRLDGSDWEDISLWERVEKANWYERTLKPKRSLLLSLHADSSPEHNARGYTVYTSRGQTQSDLVAELHYNFTKELLGKTITMRPGRWEAVYPDADQEANFTVLSRTSMPAILVEHLFFDQKDDAELLFRPDIQGKFLEAHVRTVLEYFLS